MADTLGMTKTHSLDKLLEIEASLCFSETPVSGCGGLRREDTMEGGDKHRFFSVLKTMSDKNRMTKIIAKKGRRAARKNTHEQQLTAQWPRKVPRQ